MSSVGLLINGALAVDVDLAGALLRGGGSAAAVAALLWLVRHCGRGFAGLLAGLPTVTGPAMVWLALDHGSNFAAQAAQGAVAAAVPCALFALAYAGLSLGHGRVAALCGASGVSLLCLPALALPALAQWQRPIELTLLVAGLACAGCLALMPRDGPRGGPRDGTHDRPHDRLRDKRHASPGPLTRGLPGAAAAARPGVTPLRAGAITVLVTGGVSALACLMAPSLGAHWAGVLASPPLLAAAVAVELHRQGSAAAVQDFLRGYTVGLVGRSVFMALFGALVVPRGLPGALAAALAVTLLLGWASLGWLQWRVHLTGLRSARP